MMNLNRRRQKGFTLIELLIVVAIIGIIAAILIPNLLDALQKAKQKRTVADMRNVGTSWMSWLTDQIGAASAGQDKKYDAGDYEEVLYTTLFNHLRPSSSFFYMQEVPEFDGWGHSYDYARNTNLTSAAVIILGARGRDGNWDNSDSVRHDWDVGPFIATDYDKDVVWADGYFVAWPE
ncbi:MAG: prepilin-type N-terminal cleavage/methylation domain-containing protein [Acidobacteriota bacterium]